MPSNTEAFLRHILPQEGYKAATIFSQPYLTPKGETKHRLTTNRFVKTVEELAELLLAVDRREGHVAYHACAAFKSDFNRKAENAIGARALWADLDAGPDKPYADAGAAYRAVAGFCHGLGIGMPLLVASGNGLHAYWPLTETLEPGEWRRHALGLKAAMHEAGLHADPARTADIASILRPPGTHWRKAGERLVTMGDLEGPYDIRELASRWTSSSAPSRPVSPRASTSGSTSGSTLNDKLSYAPEYEPGDADAIADQCAQVHLMRERLGRVPEPHWYAVLGVLSFCNEGLRKAQEWSSGHDAYTPEETEAKFHRAEKLTGATTCGRFYELNPDGCKGCPLMGHINSPISIKRKEWTGLQSASSPSVSAYSERSSAPWQPSSTSSEDASKTIGGVALPPLTAPFSWSRHGQLVLDSERADGSPLNITVSEHPIFLDSIQTGETQDDRFSYRFKLWLPLEGWREVTIPARAMMGPDGVNTLFGSGAAIRERDAFRRYVVLAIDQHNKTQRLKVRYEQFGWKQDESGFLYGNRLYAPTGIEPAIGSDEVKVRSQWLAPRTGGSLERWSAAANALFSTGREAFSFALLASFAAPLMRFHSVDEGGAIVSLVSRESGTGKSTALEAAASVWGRTEGLGLTNIDTKVSKALTLGVLGNLPLIYDELANRDPEVLKEFVMVFTNGRDKMRGTVDGTIRHTQARWQTVMVTAGNASIIEQIESLGGADAPGFRILEFRMPPLAGGGTREGDRLRKEMEANAGHAGDAYLRYLVTPEVLAWVKATLPRVTEEIWRDSGLQAQHRFWVRTIASVAVAARVVSELGILSFSPNRIVQWAVDQVTGRRSESLVTEAPGVSTLSRFLNEHVGSMLVMPKHWTPRDRDLQPLMTPNNGKLVVRYERENGRLLIDEAAFRRWAVRHEIGVRDLLNELESQLVVTARRKLVTLSSGTNIPGGQVPCIEINGQHPALSGFVAPVEKVMTQEEFNRRRTEK